MASFPAHWAERIDRCFFDHCLRGLRGGYSFPGIFTADDFTVNCQGLEGAVCIHCRPVEGSSIRYRKQGASFSNETIYRSLRLRMVCATELPGLRECSWSMSTAI